MNSPAACLSGVIVAALTALVPAQPPAAEPAQPGTEAAPAAEPNSLAAWRERAARAEEWLKAKAADAEVNAAAAVARARRELLGIDAPISEATLAIATRSADGTGADLSRVTWNTFDADTLSVPQPADKTVVILIHGLDEPGTIWDELTPHLLSHGATVIRFDYPNDQSLAESSKNFVAALKRLRTLGYTHVSIVAHSMGGLVARETLACADAYAGDGAGNKDLPAIDRLIMCGTPNHGAPLAGLQAIAEAREQVVRRVQGTSPEGSGLIGFTGDGCGEAGRDLCEGSDFLKALNAQPLPRHVQLTTICGVVTPAKACEYLKADASTQWAGFLGADRAAALTAQACAVVETLGDGMVPAASTRLEGVDDHVEIVADHRSMLKRWTILNKLDELRGVKTPPAEAIPVLLNRLGLEPMPTPTPVDPAPRAE